MSTETYRHPQGLDLELGGHLDDLTIAYNTYGRLNARCDNVVWVCHALTANSDVADWWPHTVEEGCFLDPDRWFVVCANILGSHYGTTGPLSTNPATGKPYYDRFPSLTIKDMVAAHRILASALGIKHIHAIVGASVGGFQALEWAVEEPARFSRIILIATEAKATPWTIAIDETQRMAITTDPTWGEPSANAAQNGLSTARAIGLLSYRGPDSYNLTQQDPESDTIPPESSHRACTYQHHQGDKLCNRFNAYSYVAILNAFDTFDCGRRRGGVDAALSTLNCPTIVVGITSDIVFPAVDMRRLADRISGAVYAEIDSRFGHDGFLVEHQQLNDILNPFIK